MLQTIIYREFLSNIITLRFLMGLFVCASLVVTSTTVLVRDYEERVGGYHLAVQAHTEEIRNIEVYSDLAYRHRPKVDKKPRLLSILNKGLEGRMGDSIQVGHTFPAYLGSQHGSDNPYLTVFPQIDLTLVFQVIISLLAFLFAYDVVAGERENGTLALTLSNPVPRSTLLLGKYLGGMLSLIVPLALSTLLGLLIIVLSSYVQLSGADWARVGAFCLVSLLYVSAFFTLGMLFSSTTRRAATALMFVMFFWVVFVLVWPHASAFAVSQFVPRQSDEHLTEEGSYAAWQRGDTTPLLEMTGEYWRETWAYAEQLGLTIKWGRPEGLEVGSWNPAGELGQTYIGGYEGAVELQPLIHDWFNFREEMNIRFANRLDEMRQRYLIENPIRQAKIAHQIARISPAGAYSHATAILANTDNESHLLFLDQARRYRSELIQYLRDIGAFSSEKWYTRDSLTDADKEGIPIFREQPEPLASSLRRAVPDILILVLLNVGFFLLTFAAFLRYDAR